MGAKMSDKIPSSVKSFLSHVSLVTKIHGVNLDIAKSRFVECGGSRCNGFFVENPKPILAVASKQPMNKWLPILAHEYSHMTQWVEKSPVWTENFVGGFETMEIIDLWIAGKIELSKEQLDDYISKARNVELDCEKRTVNIIKLFGLPIKIEEYIQKANAYVFFYKIIKNTRSWYKIGKEPYNIRSVWRWMPKDFNNNYDWLTSIQYEVLKDLTE